jgi:NAD(P)-dependent dehydrogenase (short-subunit alcohol dehydrogenase family)
MAANLHDVAQEMAGMVLFLCSDATSYVTGRLTDPAVVVDGGQAIRGLVPVENGVYAGRA